MLPQLPAIPLQNTSNSNDSAQNLNRLLPVGKNVSATVVAVSRDQIQPEIFRLKLEINNRLIQMGVFQALPVGQKINVNRQSDGQIQLSLPNPQAAKAESSSRAKGSVQNNVQVADQRSQNSPANPQQLKLSSEQSNNIIQNNTRFTAAVISSRPSYPPTSPSINTPATVTGTTNIPAATISSTPQSAPSPQLQPGTVQNASSTPPVAQGSSPPISTTGTLPQAPDIQRQNESQAPSNIRTEVQAKTPPAQVSGSSSGLNLQPATVNTVRTNAPTTSTAVVKENPQPPVTQQERPVAFNNTTRAQNIPTEPKQASNPIDIRQPLPQTAAPKAAASASTALSDANIQPRHSIAPSHHNITLALENGSKISVNAPAPLPQGTQLLLIKNDAQTLQILRQQAPPTIPSSALDKPAIQEILRNTLPAQLPTGNAFTQLAQTADSSQLSQISSVVRSMLQLFGVSPGSQDASLQIRQNIELGGLTTEQRLSQGLVPEGRDMKSQLSQLQQLADKLPEEQRERFEQIIKGMQSRITSQQLNSLQQWRELPDGGFERVLQLDLPIKQGEQWENLELRLSREGGTNAAGEMVSVWRVRLHFDLEELGGVDSEIRLTDGHEIKTLFWCELPETAEKLKERADEFSERLRSCGFSQTEVDWHEGAAPNQNQSIHKQLVDLHT